MTTTVPPGGHSGSLGLMSCVRESSPQDLVPQTELVDIERNETKKRRFHPFRGLRKMFRRNATSTGTPGKVRNAGSEETVPVQSCLGGHEDSPVSTKDAHRSRSTSELLAAEESAPRRKSGSANGNGGTGGMYAGGGNLSVSHDSVFTAEQHSIRGDSTSSDLDTAQSSSSLSIQQLMHHTGVRAELLDVVRRRGRGRGDTSEDEEDLGLPRSPCNSPTTTDKALKEHPTKSHSTCSDGSLLSMGSSEMDEDSFGQQSRHSSKLSLQDRRPSQAIESEFELGIITAPLSHSAARHKMAVRPKRTHGAPRRRRVQQLTAGSALPTTPEVNEEISTRSLTPEGSNIRETIAELYAANNLNNNNNSSSTSTSMSKAWNMSSSAITMSASAAATATSTSTTTLTDIQLKSASLPPGLALPSGSNKLSRSRSNAGGKGFVEEDEDVSMKDEKTKKEESFFGRFLARRSGKKKKSKSEEINESETTTTTTTTTSASSLRTSVMVNNTSIPISKSVDKVVEISSLIGLQKYTDDNKRTYSVDSGISLKSNATSNVAVTAGSYSKSGPAARQRVQPIDIPASPEQEIFRHKKRQQQQQQQQQHQSGIDVNNVSPPPPTSPTSSSCSPSATDLGISPPAKKMHHTFLPRQSKPIMINSDSTENSSTTATTTTTIPPIPSPRTILPRKPEILTPAPRHIINASTNSPPKLSTWAEIKFTEHPPPPPSITTAVNGNRDDGKTKVKITGLSSYQQRVMSYSDNLINDDDNKFKSLEDTSETDSSSITTTTTFPSLTKSQSFRTKPFVPVTQDHSSLPYSVNFENTTTTISSDTSETFTDSLMSTTTTGTSDSHEINQYKNETVTVNNNNNTTTSSTTATTITNSNNVCIDHNEVKIINTNSEINPCSIEKKDSNILIENNTNSKAPPVLASASSSSSTVFISTEKDPVTISCVNAQVNTKNLTTNNISNNNQVIVNINHSSVEQPSPTQDVTVPTTTTTAASPSLNSQVSITKVQLKRDSKTEITDSSHNQVPEFLKIQLNKVDIKAPSTNVVLTTVNSLRKSDENISEQQNNVDDNDNDSNDVKQASVQPTPSKTKIDVKPAIEKTFVEIETDRDSGEIIKRKFSSDNVEIIDKDKSADEEIIQVPIRNIINNRKSSYPIASANASSSSSSSSVKAFLKKKSNSLELTDSLKLIDVNITKPLTGSTDQLLTTQNKNDDKQQDTDGVVVLRKKSLTNQKRNSDSKETSGNSTGGGGGGGDEPELMKVFARRSLKLKDSEAETLSQQVLVLVEDNNKKLTQETQENGKRDSDKENEGTESPIEERKKSLFSCSSTKEPLAESKIIIDSTIVSPTTVTSDVTLRKPSSTLNNKFAMFGGSKYQRPVTLPTTTATIVPNNDVLNDNNTTTGSCGGGGGVGNAHEIVGEKRKNKSFIEPKQIVSDNNKKPVVISNFRSSQQHNILKDLEIKTTTNEKNEDELKKKNFENEDFVPKFKRIQQRKEEWEKRAQQNMKKSVP